MRAIATEVLFDGINLRQPGDLFEIDDKLVKADREYAAKNSSATFPYKPAPKSKGGEQDDQQIV